MNIRAVMAILGLDVEHMTKSVMLDIACRAKPGYLDAPVSRYRIAVDLSLNYWTVCRAITRAKEMGYIQETEERITRRSRGVLTLTRKILDSPSNGSRGDLFSTSTSAGTKELEGQEKDVHAPNGAAPYTGAAVGAQGGDTPPASRAGRWRETYRELDDGSVVRRDT